MAHPRSSLASLVETFDQLGSDIAVVTPVGLRRHQTTYSQLARLARRFASELHSRGIGKGERVVICGQNSAEWIGAFFGCVLGGVIAVPLDVGSTPEFVGRVVADVNPRLCIVDEQRLGSIRNSPTLLFQNLTDREAPAIANLGEEDPLQIVFTSGTTGDPKGIVHTHKNVLASLRPIETEVDKYRRYERWFHPIRLLHTLPLSHVFGQFMGLWIPGLIGLELHFRDRIVGAELVDYIRVNRISVLATVPRVLDLMAAHIAGTTLRLRERIEKAGPLKAWQRWWLFRDVHRMLGWKFWAIVCGGAALPPETEQFWGMLGFAVIQGYGMTETTALVSLNHPFHLARGTVGQVLPGREVQLSSEGEVLVRGETIATAIWQGGGMRTARSDWLATGDLADYDSAGNLRFRGRKKDVIVTAAGLNIHPEDLESALLRQAGTREAAVVEVAGPGGPEPVAALIVANGNEAASRIVSGANAELAEFQKISRWVVWPEPDFPRTSTGKVLRREIARRIASGELTSKRAGDEGMPLDSLARVELQAQLEAQYGVAIPDEVVQQAENAGDARARVNKLAQRAARPDEHKYPRWPWRRLVQAVRAIFIEAVAMPLLRFLAAPRAHRLPDELASPGPFLIIANHVTSYDPPFVLAALPGTLRRRVAIAMSGEMILDWRRARNQGNWFFNLLAPLEYYVVTALFNIFPLPQESGFRRSFQHAGEAVDRGYSVLVFPEGLRSPDGRPLPFKTGAGLLWKQLGVPVIPVHIEGLGELKVVGKGWFRSGRITVRARGLLPPPKPDRSPEELTAQLCDAVFGKPTPSDAPSRRLQPDLQLSEGSLEPSLEVRPPEWPRT